jgi:hypothetical protein
VCGLENEGSTCVGYDSIIFRLYLVALQSVGTEQLRSISDHCLNTEPAYSSGVSLGLTILAKGGVRAMTCSKLY